MQIAAETAVSANCFSRVIVSSEDPHILSATEGLSGVTNSKRPEVLSGDDIRADEVIRWEIAQNALDSDTLVCCLLPTTPLLAPNLLTEAANKYTEGVLFGVIPTSETPYRSFRLESDGSTINPLFPEMLKLQSQDYPQSVVDAGQFYFANANTWNQNFSITACANTKGFLLDPRLAIDLNYPEDWDKLIRHS